MKIGAMTDPGKNLFEQLEEFKDLGFDLIEVCVEGPEAKAENLDLERIKEFSQENKIGIIAHAPWELNFGTPYKEMRKGSVKEMKEIIEKLNEIGIEFVTADVLSIVSGSYKQTAKNKVIKSFIKSASEIMDYAEGKNVEVGFENSRGLIKLKDFNKFFEEVPDMKMTLDIGHAYLEKREERPLIGFIEENIDKIKHFHFHDSLGKSDDHLPLGAGEIKWKKILKAVKNSGYDNTITVEVHSHDSEYAYISKRKLEREWGTL